MGSADSITEQEMIQYLLGELSAEETDRFEERYFTDDETFDRLLTVKADLIDHYLHGQLVEQQTNRFESFFLNSPDHRREVALMRSLLKLDSETLPPNAPPATVKPDRASLIEKIERLFGALPAWAHLTATAFAALLIVGFACLMIANRRMRDELDALRVQQQTAITREQELQQLVAALQSQNSTLTQTSIPTTSPNPTILPSPRTEALPALVFAITLTPGQSRSAGASPELKISVDATNQTTLPIRPRKIQLELLLDRDFGYRSYAVALKNASDKTIQTRSGLRVVSSSSGDAIKVEFLADNLKPGDYAATLSGTSAKGRLEEIADYPFRIVKQ